MNFATINVFRLMFYTMHWYGTTPAEERKHAIQEFDRKARKVVDDLWSIYIFGLKISPFVILANILLPPIAVAVFGTIAGTLAIVVMKIAAFLLPANEAQYGLYGVLNHIEWILFGSLAIVFGTVWIRKLLRRIPTVRVRIQKG